MVLTLTILVPSSGQPSTSSHGCTFADDQYVYNVELLPETRDLVCPTNEVLLQTAGTTMNRVNEMQATVNTLRRLAVSLQQRNTALLQNIQSTQLELQETKLAVAAKLGCKYLVLLFTYQTFMCLFDTS